MWQKALREAPKDPMIRQKLTKAIEKVKASGVRWRGEREVRVLSLEGSLRFRYVQVLFDLFLDR